MRLCNDGDDGDDGDVGDDLEDDAGLESNDHRVCL